MTAGTISIIFGDCGRDCVQIRKLNLQLLPPPTTITPSVMCIKIGAWSEILICTWGGPSSNGGVLVPATPMLHVGCSGSRNIVLVSLTPTPKYCGFSVISTCVTSMKGLAGLL